MADTRLADISEYQESIDAPAYIGGGYRCLIVRAHNGGRADKKWPARRDYLRGYDFTALGWYQYVQASKDATQQAKDFVNCVGELRGNEFMIGDFEEGSGSQVSRAEAWFAVVDKAQGFPATLYSGQSFGKTNLGGWSRWQGRPRWIAAYSSQEPTDQHELWQNTDKASFPGLAGGVDGNIFHGSADQFLKTMRPGGKAPATPTTPARQDTIAVAAMPDGRLEVFEQLPSGEVMHRWNAQGGGWTSKWESLGRPGG